MKNENNSKKFLTYGNRYLYTGTSVANRNFVSMDCKPDCFRRVVRPLTRHYTEQIYRKTTGACTVRLVCRHKSFPVYQSDSNGLVLNGNIWNEVAKVDASLLWWWRENMVRNWSRIYIDLLVQEKIKSSSVWNTTHCLQIDSGQLSANHTGMEKLLFWNIILMASTICWN